MDTLTVAYVAVAVLAWYPAAVALLETCDLIAVDGVSTGDRVFAAFTAIPVAALWWIFGPLGLLIWGIYKLAKSGKLVVRTRKEMREARAAKQAAERAAEDAMREGICRMFSGSRVTAMPSGTVHTGRFLDQTSHARWFCSWCGAEAKRHDGDGPLFDAHADWCPRYQADTAKTLLEKDDEE